MRSPLPCVAYVKNVTKRQSKSVRTVAIAGQSPFPFIGGISVDVTVNVNGVITCGSKIASECAFGSRQGFPGDGFGFDGQSNVAIPVTFVPGVKGTGIEIGCGVNDAVTTCGEFIVTLHTSVPLQAPPHPANEEFPVGVAVKITGVPGAKFAEQFTAGQTICPFASATLPVPVPISVTVNVKLVAAFTDWLTGADAFEPKFASPL